MLGDAFQADIDKALDAQAARPLAPPKPPTRFKDSVWAQPIRGLAAGLGDMLAGGSELAVGMYRQSRAMDTADPVERKRQQEQGVPFDGATEFSRDLRKVAAGYRPDPATAGAAENLVFGLSRVIPKAVGYTLAAGPVGAAAALGVDEALTTHDELTSKGVDKNTADKVALVTGVASGAGIVLPMSGATVAKTAGLYALGGPGAFVAQQAATREILSTANYGDLAKQYDPLDPVGLAMSALIPLPFAAWGIRANVKGAKAVEPPAPRIEPALLPEHVDAAMVHNLTLARDVRASVEDGATTAAATATKIESLAEYSARRAVAEVKAPAAGPDTFLTWLQGRGGVASSEKLDITGERSGLSRGAIFRKGGRQLDDLAQLAEEAGYLPPGTVASAMDNGGTRAVADLIQRAAGGERILTVEQGLQKAARDRMDSDVQQRVELLENRLRLLGEDPAPAKGDLNTLETYLAQNEDRLLRAQMESIVEQQRAMDTEASAPPRETKTAPQVEQARIAAQDLADSGKTLEAFAADGKFAPDVQNLLLGIHEAGGDGARVARMLSDFQRTTDAQPGRSPVDIAADVVEASRTGTEVTPEAKAAANAAPSTPEQAVADSITNRLAVLEKEAPNMVVRIADDGTPVTLADELATIRREAAEGTDSTLGSNDAPLLQVAAECALSMGQA